MPIQYAISALCYLSQSTIAILLLPRYTRGSRAQRLTAGAGSPEPRVRADDSARRVTMTPRKQLNMWEQIQDASPLHL